MGWFSNPKCPRCGQESSLATAWDGDYYTCYPCVRKAKKEKKRIESIEKQLIEMEEKLKRIEKE